MKNIFKLFFLFLLSISLSACVTTKIVKEEVIVIEYKIVEIPKEYRTICKVTPPFKDKDYLQSSRDKKESMLFELSTSLYTDLKNCNDQIESLDKLYLEKKKIYEQQQR